MEILFEMDILISLSSPGAVVIMLALQFMGSKFDPLSDETIQSKLF